jgi:hypothetical protein
VSVTPAPDTPASAGRAPSRLLAALVGVPDRLVMLLFWTCLVVSVTVLAEAFRPALVLPLLAVTIVATWRLVPGPLVATRSSAAGAGAALVLAAAWLAANVPFASSYVVVDRDPGFLTLEGIWLARHASPVIPVGASVQLADAVPGVLVDNDAYFESGGALYAQGAKLLPGLLGLAGWAGGPRAVVVANLVVGAVGLVAVYALARRFLPPAWALVPMVALGLSLPMMVFSRAAYTEPVAMALVLEGITMSWSAFETRAWWRHLLAGALVGGAALARIDGAGAAIGLVVGVGVAAGAALARPLQGRLRTSLLATVLGAWATVGLGYADLRRHSPGYLDDLGSQVGLLLGALFAVTVVCLLLALPWRPGALWRAVARHRRGLGAVACALVVVAGVALALRPLLFVNHGIEADSGYDRAIAALQEREGLPIDPTRSYDEQTVTWLSWYFGWAALVAALAGFAMLVLRAVRDRDARRLVLVTVVAAPSALYLWRANITPDQIWAIRRFLPVTIPGLLVAAGVALEALWRDRSRVLHWLSVPAAAMVALFPLLTWGSVVGEVEHDGRLDEAEAVCDAVGTDPVLFVSPGDPGNYLATIRSLCDVDAAQWAAPATAETLTAVRDAWGDDVAVVTFSADAVPWTGAVAPDPLLETTTTRWRSELTHAPDTADERTSQVWVGHITPAGTVTAVPGVAGEP